jgi:YVTN family beta-propeller protein
MRRISLKSFLMLSLLASGAGALPAAAGGDIVVANRGDGTISVIDIATDTVMPVAMPAGSGIPEPMYVSYAAPYARVFVGDRANDRIVVFRASDYSVEASVPAGAGVFHMWSADNDDQLWVNNDIDNTITVIDTVTLDVVTTIPLPADLVALGGKPHDVVLESNGTSAFVTMLGIAGANDYVIKYSRQTFSETARQAVGKDPHVSLARQNDLLYVPCQNSNAVFVLDRDTLAADPSILVLSAHGAGMSRNGKAFYTTNLAGGGTGGLVEIDTGTNTAVGVFDTPLPVPHNIALAPNGKKLYVTHSGATSDKVSVFERENKNSDPVLIGTLTVGQNPFGIAFVP